MENNCIYQKKQTRTLLNSYNEIAKDIEKLFASIERYTDVSNMETVKNLANSFERNHLLQKIKQSARSIMTKLLDLFSKIDDFWVSMDVRLIGKCINEIIQSVHKFYLAISALKPINMSWPRPIAKMTEYQRFFKADSRMSVMFLKDVQKRLESSLPNCSHKTAMDIVKITKQYQNLFQLTKLTYGSNEERSSAATVVDQHRNTSKNLSVSMQNKALIKIRIKRCTGDTFCITNISTVQADDSNEKSALATSKNEMNKLVDDCKMENEVSKKRKQMDEINKPTEGVMQSTDCKDKIKVDKRKITVAEYFARKSMKRNNNETKMNENATKRKRELSECHESSDNENRSNDLDACDLNAHKKTKFSAA